MFIPVTIECAFQTVQHEFKIVWRNSKRIHTTSLPLFTSDHAYSYNEMLLFPTFFALKVTTTFFVRRPWSMKHEDMLDGIAISYEVIEVINHKIDNIDDSIFRGKWGIMLVFCCLSVPFSSISLFGSALFVGAFWSRCFESCCN